MPDPTPATREEILDALVEADSYLSLVGWRYPSKFNHDLIREMKAASAKCRSLAERIEVSGIKHGRTLTEEDWNV